jgi:hypothetical protein
MMPPRSLSPTLDKESGGLIKFTRFAPEILLLNSIEIILFS